MCNWHPDGSVHAGTGAGWSGRDIGRSRPSDQARPYYFRSPRRWEGGNSLRKAPDVTLPKDQNHIIEP
eukprot:1188859-Prorocentrum_minimum.AAC.1